MKTITIWSDFACPYCYIGEKRLKDAIKELGVENEVKIEYRAFELDPNAPLKVEGTVAERLAAKYGLSPEEAEKKIKEIDELGKEVGLDMHYGKAKPSNTFDAHRLLKFAQYEYEPQITAVLNDAIFAAYFTMHKRLSDRELLLKLAEDAGLDATQANEVLRSDLYADQVRYDEREAHDRAVRGVPYMIFDGEFAVPGAISTEDFKTCLREMLANKKDTARREAPTCDETGCKI